MVQQIMMLLSPFRDGIDLLPFNKSPEPTAVGAASWRPQRCHDMDAPNIMIAARTVIAIAVHAASRRWLAFYADFAA